MSVSNLQRTKKPKVDLMICVSSLQAIAAKGGDFLEAPVSGSKQPAEMATLIILAAGSKVHRTSTLCQLGSKDLLPCINVLT